MRKPQLRNIRTFRLEKRAEADGPSIAISSEAEVDRGWYVEILSHDPGSVVLERSAMGLSFLVNHDSNRLAGMVDNVRLEDRKLRGDLRFGSSVLAQEISRDIDDLIRPFISVGYNILDYREEKRDGTLYIIATKWEPLEVSTVPIPADFQGAGIGRSEGGCANPNCTDPDCEDPDCEGECSVEKKCSACASKRSQAPANRGIQNPPALPAGIQEVRMDITPEMAAQQSAEARNKGINEALEAIELATRAGLNQEASAMLREGKSADQIRAMILDKIMERGGNPFKAAPVELTEQEQKRYSIARALLSHATGLACFEREVSQDLAKKLGREAGGIYVPTNLVTQQRAQDATVTTQAKGLISNENVTFIELLRNAAVVLRAGATYLPGCVGNIPFARQNAGGTATWTGDNPASAVAASDPTVEVFTMSPKQLMANRIYSKQLLVQTGGFADAYVTNDLAAAHALEVDRASMFGSGTSNQPTGLVSMSGIGAVAGGTNGLAPTWANVVGLETAISSANALDGALKYVSNSKARGYFKTTLKNAVAGANYILGDDNRVNGYDFLTSNQVPSNLTKGTSAGVCSAILFGNWSELLIAEWGALDLVTDPYSLADKGLIRVVSTQLVDINARHVQSFSAMLDALC